MLLDIFQTFSEQLFSRQLWTAGIIYNLYYFEKQSPAKKGVLKNFTKFKGKHLCQSLFFNKVEGLRPAYVTLAQVFFCEFYEIFKNVYGGCFGILKISVQATEFIVFKISVNYLLLKNQEIYIRFFPADYVFFATICKCLCTHFLNT